MMHLSELFNAMLLYIHRYTIRTIRDGQLRTATSTFTQFLSSEAKLSNSFT